MILSDWRPRRQMVHSTFVFCSRSSGGGPLQKSRVLVLIPARYASSRFPGKPLAKLAGKSVIQRVYENCAHAPDPHFQTCVVTDDQRIEDEVRRFGGQVKRVDDNVPSGSERIMLCLERHFADSKWDLVINVQGDEPLVTRADLDIVAKAHLESSFDILTVVRERKGAAQDFRDPNKVKAVFSPTTKRCLYFSRAPVPYAREKGGDLGEIPWYLHVGLYSYRPEALKRFGRAPASHYEGVEQLEQLRALEMGLSIGAVALNKEFHGVDVPADLVKLEGVLNGRD